MKKRLMVCAALGVVALSTIAQGAVKTVAMNCVSYSREEGFYLDSYEVEYTGSVRLDVLMVDEIIKEGDMWRMTSIGQNGNEWELLIEDGDMFEGDLISVMFDDMGTREITDDEIISWRYCGWVSDSEMSAWVK